LGPDIYGIIVLKRDDGLVLYSKIYKHIPNSKTLDYYDPDRYRVFSGLVSAVSGIVSHVADDYIKSLKLEGEDKIKIIIETSKKVAVSIISTKDIADRKIFNLANSLVKQFNYFYEDALSKWNGKLSNFTMFNKVVEKELGNKNIDFTEYL
jgi:hypothetical protein